MTGVADPIAALTLPEAVWTTAAAAINAPEYNKTNIVIKTLVILILPIVEHPQMPLKMIPAYPQFSQWFIWGNLGCHPMKKLNILTIVKCNELHACLLRIRLLKVRPE